MTRTEIWLIRHGETDWNAEQRLQGWRDIPLNDVGKAQALSVQRYLEQQRIDFDAVLSSDLQRAIQTAQIAFEPYGYQVEQLSMLRERNYGIYEGQPWQQLIPLPDRQAPTINLRDPQTEIPEGESLPVFYQRIIRAFNQIAQDRPQQKLAVVAHGGVIDMVWRHIKNIDLTSQRPYKIMNASVNHFRITTQLWEEVAWAQTDHIERANEGL